MAGVSDSGKIGDVRILTAKPAPPATPRPLRKSRQQAGTPISDVNTLSIVSAEVGAKIKAAAGLKPDTPPPAPAPAPVMELDSPGSERWPVKTGQDPDRVKVGKNVIDSVDLGAGIVAATVGELVQLPRPAGMTDAKKNPPQFQSVRDGVAEISIWQIEATIIAMKHESDGDYHLVLQASTGEEMVGEIPTGTTEFVGDSPWIANIAAARKAIDDKLVKHLKAENFVFVRGKYEPRGSATVLPEVAADPRMTFVTPPAGSGIQQPLFRTALTPTMARLTGVGFFDRAHGATGAAPNVIELHPVLKVEWI